MSTKKNILAIIGSASSDSVNEKLINKFIQITETYFNVTVYNRLKLLPHFDPELSGNNPPQLIVELRNLIEKADGVIICTPEYVFSIPAGLKNALEWCVASTIFSGKPTGLITASSAGEKGHQELQLIMQTLSARCNSETTLLISGVKSKLNISGEIKDEATLKALMKFSEAFKILINP